MKTLEELRKIADQHILLGLERGVPESEIDYWESWKNQLDYGYRPTERPTIKPTILSQPSWRVSD